MKKKDTKGVVELPRKPAETKTSNSETDRKTAKKQSDAKVKQPVKTSTTSAVSDTPPKQGEGTGVVKDKKNAGFGRKAWDFFCSVKLAVIIIIIAAVACVVGTFIIQQKTEQEYVSRYGEFFTSLLQATQLTDVFHSYWFTALLLLLCTNLTCCTIKRWRNSIMQLGFISTHLSINLILIGAVIGFQFGEKGGVNIYEGQSANFFFEFNSGREIPLGFSVFCDDFILEKHPPKFELLSFVKSRNFVEPLTTEIDVEHKIPGNRYAVTVKDYIPDAELRRQPINTSDELKNPAIFVQLFSSEKVSVEGWLIASTNNWYLDKEKDLKIEYLWAKSKEDLEGMIADTGAQQQPTLTVTDKEKDAHGEFPIEVGREFDLEGTGYHIKVAEFALDYANKAKPLNEQQAENPAVRLEINGPEGTANRWVFAKYPDWGDMHSTKYKSLQFGCVIPESIAFTSNTLRIIQGPDAEMVLAYISKGKPLHRETFELAQKYDIGETGQQVAVSKYYPSFGFKEEVVQNSDEVKIPALRVEIDGPKGRVTDWVFADSPESTAYPDENFFLRYKQTGQSIKDYKSKLRVVEDGKTVVAKTIEVNDPLTYKGYSFYQSSYDPKGERYTGLQISKDPGLPVVYTGFSIMCFGIIFIFYIKPFLRRKRKKVG